MVELLLADGAALRVDEPDRGQWTALHYAAKQGALDAVKLLLAHGADRRALDQRGRTPLDVAQEFEQVEAHQFLHSLNDSSKPMTFTVCRPPWSSVLDHKVLSSAFSFCPRSSTYSRLNTLNSFLLTPLVVHRAARANRLAWRPQLQLDG